MVKLEALGGLSEEVHTTVVESVENDLSDIH